MVELPRDANGEDQEPPPRRLQVLAVNQTAVAVDLDRLAAAVEAALDGSPYDRGEVSLAVVDDATIHQLNRQFLDHDYPTDVLSFPLEDEPPRLLGEIVASAETAARAAAEVGWSAADELLLYVIHGALHLAGHGDQSPHEAAAMRAAESAVLGALGVVPAAADPRWRSGPEEPSP